MELQTHTTNLTVIYRALLTTPNQQEKIMSTYIHRRLVFAVCFITGTVLITPSLFASKAGFAERDITPEIGMEQPGGYGKLFHKKFHDACKVRVAVFDDGNKRAAIVGVDALGVPRHLVQTCRRAIEQRCGIRECCHDCCVPFPLFGTNRHGATWAVRQCLSVSATFGL